MFLQQDRCNSSCCSNISYFHLSESPQSQRGDIGTINERGGLLMGRRAWARATALLGQDAGCRGNRKSPHVHDAINHWLNIHLHFLIIVDRFWMNQFQERCSSPLPSVSRLSLSQKFFFFLHLKRCHVGQQLQVGQRIDRAVRLLPTSHGNKGFNGHTAIWAGRNKSHL